MHQNLVDQLRVFLAVVEHKSLSGAARQLGRAVSSVSYAIDRLEGQYGVSLFGWESGKFQLTTEGSALLRDAELTVEGARRFEARAQILESGAEAVVRIGADLVFPQDLLVECLGLFSQAHPGVRLQLFLTSLNRSWEELTSKQVDFSLSPLRNLPLWVEKKPLLSEQMIVVVSPEHPLAAIDGPISLAELRNHRQLYYATPDVDIENQGRIFATDFWTVNDLQLLNRLVCDGVGWSFGTKNWIAADIEAGRLAQLSLSDMLSDGVWTFGALWPIDRPPGRLGNEFLSMLYQIIETRHHGGNSPAAV